MRVWATVLALALGWAGALSAQRHLAPFEYRSHFEPNAGASAESGSRDGWESYPTVQEVGYEPTLNPETSQGVSALVRETAPTQDGDFKLGFVRRMHLVSGSKASLEFWICVPYASAATSIGVSIFRGGVEERLDASVRGAGWQRIELRVGISDAEITALAIAADFPHAVRGRPERVMLRDVRLNALAVGRIELAAPAALWDPSRELYYLQRAVRPGSELSVRLAAPAGQKVVWMLTAPDGHKSADAIGNDFEHQFAAPAEVGVWTLHATSGEGEMTALLLVSPVQPRGILFDQAPAISAELLASVRKRRDALRAKTHIDAGMNIATMDDHWLLAGLTSYFSALMQAPELAMLDAIDYRASGDGVALGEAKTLLAGIARWPVWTHPWFPAHGYHSYYPVGIMTRDLVMAEQFLGNDLSTEQRLALDRSLMTLAVKPIYEEYVQEDRLQFNTSNWIGNTVGGALLAALQSVDPDAAGYALGLYAKDRDHVAAAYTADGSYGEGVSYHRYDLETTALVAEASKRILGQSMDRYLRGGESYMRYASYGLDGLLDYGDSHVDIRPANVFASIAAQNQSDALTEFYFKYRDTGSAELLSRVLWEAQIKRPASEPAPGPAAKLFDQRGIVVLRSGWSPDATVIAMRAGKNFNHNHADEGSVFFAEGGKLWLGEAGYADYYKDPSYSTFNIQAIGHNTLLLDGNGESQIFPGNAVFGTAPSIEHCLLSDRASLVQADLTAAYSGDLVSYTRTLFYRAGGPLFAIDRVQAASPHVMTQVWHPKQTLAMQPGQNAFDLSDGHRQVHVSSFATVPMTTIRRDSSMPLALYDQAERGMVERPQRIEFTTRSSQTQATIVTVITPGDVTTEDVPRVASNELQKDFTVEAGETGVSVNDAPAGSHGGASVLAWWKGGMAMLQGEYLRDRESGGSIRFSEPVDLRLARLGHGEMRLDVDASSPTHITLTDLVPLPGFKRQKAEGVQSLDVAAGHTTLRLRVAHSASR